MSTKREISGGVMNAGDYSLACPVGRLRQSGRFNGMGKDEEVGNSLNYKYCMHDPRLGRWFCIDPVIHEWQSPYCAFDNNPIAIADPSGADGEPKSTNRKADEGEWKDENNNAVVFELPVCEVFGFKPFMADNTIKQDNTYVNDYQSLLFKDMEEEISSNGYRYLDGASDLINATTAAIYSVDIQYYELNDGSFWKKSLTKGAKTKFDFKTFTRADGTKAYAVEDLATSLKFLKYAGIATSAFIIINDCVDVQNQVEGSVSVLFMDFTGSVIAYYNPVTGLLYTAYNIVTNTEEFYDGLYREYQTKRNKIIKGYIDKGLGYVWLYDSEAARFDKLMGDIYPKTSFYRPPDYNIQTILKQGN